MLSHHTNLMSKWSSLPLAWMSRITIVMMSISAKILYLFRVLPIQVPSFYLCILQRRTLNYIWSKLKPCLPKPTLYTPHIRGGLGVPYYVAQLAQLPKYHATKEILLWEH